MVAFARAKAKSIFSKLRFTGIYQQEIDSNEGGKNKKISMHQEKYSNNFLEAIKNGGIWLS